MTPTDVDHFNLLFVTWFAAWLATEIGYTPRLIWMKEFQTHQGLGIHLLPEGGEEYLTSGSLWHWLRERKYVIDWCCGPWACGLTGEITDT